MNQIWKWVKWILLSLVVLALILAIVHYASIEILYKLVPLLLAIVFLAGMVVGILYLINRFRRGKKGDTSVDKEGKDDSKKGSKKGSGEEGVLGGIYPKLEVWSRQYLFWIFLAGIIEIFLLIFGLKLSALTWQIVIGATAVFAFIAGIDRYLGAELKEIEIVDLITSHEKKKREIRRLKKTCGYDKLRRNVLRKKLNVSRVIRENRGSNDPDADDKILQAETELEKAEEELAKIELGEGETKSKLETIKDDIDAIKSKRKDIEKRMVLDHLMPFASAMVLAVVLVLFFVSTFLSSDNQTDGFLWSSRALFGGLVVCLCWYLWVSRTAVTITNRGLKFFRSKFYAEITRGPRLALKWLVHIASISTEVQRYDMKPIEAKIADRKGSTGGKHSQVIYVDVYYLYHIEKTLDAVTELGGDMIAIKLKLEGSGKAEVIDGVTKYDEGIIGALLSSYVREFIAEEIETLDEGYQVRDDLASELKKILMDHAEYLGIRIDNVFVTDVKGTKEIETARNKREEANIEKETAVVRAEEKVEVAKRTATEKQTIADAEAGVKLKIGTAEADVVLLKGTAEAKANQLLGEAEAAVILAQLTAKINAITNIDPAAKTQALKAVPFLLPILLGEKVIPETAQALNGLKLNVFAFSDLQKAFKDTLGPLFSLFGGDSDSGGV